MRDIWKSLVRVFAEPATRVETIESAVAGSAKSRLAPMFLLALPLPLQAQNIDLFEYFIDTNTAFESGQQIVVNPAAADVEIAFNPNISALSSGHHVIYHRVRDTTGDWSPTLSTPFFLEPGVDTQDDPEIEEMEVFYNTGNFPIGGSGTPIVVPTAGNVVTEPETLNLSGEETGFNIAYFRVKGSSGLWGPSLPYAFFNDLTGGPDPATDITNIEAFLNDDPGQGSGKDIDPSTPANDVTASGTLVLSDEPTGFNILNLRAQNSHGFWGPPIPVPLFNDISNGPDAAGPIDEMRYFIDADPGLGMGEMVTITTGTTVDQNFNVNLMSEPLGHHTLYIRAQKENSIWGPPMPYPLFVENNVQTAPLPNIVQIDYSLVLGGNAPVTVNGSFNGFVPATQIDETFNIDASAFSVGDMVQLVVTVVDSNATVSLDVQSGVGILAGYDFWKTLFFSGADLYDEMVSGFTADPDNDGIPNGIEFALNSDPTVSSTGDLPVVTEDGTFLEITYRQFIGGTGTVGVDYTFEGIQYTVQVASDLAADDWMSGSVLVEKVGSAINNGDGTETVTVRLLEAIGGVDKKFLRLQITLL